VLDKSIPYFNVLMKRQKEICFSKLGVPDGFSFTKYTSGDEKYWAEIETSVGEFTEGLGRPLVNYGIRTLIELDGNEGFQFMENGTFGGYKNDFNAALPLLKQKIDLPSLTP
jgi:hypothetical protein